MDLILSQMKRVKQNKNKKSLILSSNPKSRNDSLRAWPWQIWNSSGPVSGLSLAVVENAD